MTRRDLVDPYAEWCVVWWAHTSATWGDVLRGSVPVEAFTDPLLVRWWRAIQAHGCITEQDGAADFYAQDVDVEIGPLQARDRVLALYEQRGALQRIGAAVIALRSGRTVEARGLVQDAARWLSPLEPAEVGYDLPEVA